MEKIIVFIPEEIHVYIDAHKPHYEYNFEVMYPYYIENDKSDCLFL